MLAIGVLAVSACAFDGLEEVFVVGFTPREVQEVSTLLEQLRDGEIGSHLDGLPPAVRQMHACCLAGGRLVGDSRPVGLDIAWQAASAGATPPPTA